MDIFIYNTFFLFRSFIARKGNSDSDVSSTTQIIFSKNKISKIQLSFNQKGIKTDGT